MIYMFGYTCGKSGCECQNERTQHCLTIRAATLWQAVNEAGFNDDETITFAGIRYPGGIGYCPFPDNEKEAVA